MDSGDVRDEGLCSCINKDPVAGHADLAVVVDKRDPDFAFGQKACFAGNNGDCRKLIQVVVVLLTEE